MMKREAWQAVTLLGLIGILGYLIWEHGRSIFNFVEDYVSGISKVAEVAKNAGFSGADLVTAIAIAMAESSGNPDAHGDTGLGGGTGSFGLWQIYSDAHPEFGPDFSKLYDPQTNANAAYSVYVAAGRSFKPWSTFKSGAYSAFVAQAQGASAV